MKKIILSGLAAAAVAAAGAPAALADVQLIGRITYSAAAGPCPANPTGDRFTVRFRPAGFDGNTDSSITIFHESYAESFVLPNGSFTKNFKTVEHYDLYSGVPFHFPLQGEIKFSSQKPATITETTDFVSVEGKIKNWSDTAGCDVDFRMIVVRPAQP